MRCLHIAYLNLWSDLVVSTRFMTSAEIREAFLRYFESQVPHTCRVEFTCTRQRSNVAVY